MMLAPTYPEIDSERQVVIEEIAMYDDEPQDRVHDVLADAVFGSHPLGRRVLGEADVIANIPIPDISSYHQARYTGLGDRRRRGRAPRPRRDRRPGRKARQPADRGWRRRPGDGADRAAAALLPGQGDRAVPHLLRRARDRSPRRAALPARGARLHLRRLDLLAALPRGAREARAGLLGRLLQRAVHRPGPGRHLRRHPRGQRRGGLRDHRHRARRACAPSRSRRRSSTGPRRASRGGSSSPPSRPRRG